MWRSIAVGCSLLGFGCASTVPAHSPTFAETRLTADPGSPSPKDDSAVLAVADDIRKACGLSQVESHFEYDSARLRSREAGVVEQLAVCLREGPLAGRRVRLIGHADARGEHEYNLALAGRRADAVSQALTERRVAAAQLSATSRGALDAQGTDEKSWQLDRRVDVLLAD